MGLLHNGYAALRDLVKREVDYVRVQPTHGLLFLTYRCTSRCQMCTIWQRGETVDVSDELTLQDWKACVDMLLSAKVKVIELFGGDALLRKDVLIPLIHYIRSKDDNIIIDLPTNCNLLDQQTAKDLVKAGVTRLYVSLDGTVDTHDRIRGTEGTFTKVERALSYVREAKQENGGYIPRIICNCTISSLNVNTFDNIIPIAERSGADCVEFEYVGEISQRNAHDTDVGGVTPTPFYVARGPSILLNRQQALLLKSKMRRIRALPFPGGMVVATQHIDVLSIRNLVSGTIPNKKCYICRYMVAVDPYGNVMGCLHFNNYFYGNLKKEPLSAIWNNSRHIAFIRSQQQGRIRICENCISGVHRNPSFIRSIIRKVYLTHQVRPPMR